MTDPSCIILSRHVGCASAIKGRTHATHSMERASVPLLLRTERTGFNPRIADRGGWRLSDHFSKHRARAG